MLVLQPGIPPVFDRTRAPSGQLVRDQRPPISEFLLALENNLILPLLKWLVLDTGHQPLEPPLAALLCGPRGDELGDVGPLLGAKLVHCCYEELIFLLIPRSADDCVVLFRILESQKQVKEILWVVRNWIAPVIGEA